MDESRFDRMEAKIDKIIDHVANIDSTLAVQAAQITYHIKRTDLAEANTEILRSAIAPLTEAKAMAHGAAKLLAAVGGVIGVAYYVVKIVSGG